MYYDWVLIARALQLLDASPGIRGRNFNTIGPSLTNNSAIIFGMANVSVSEFERNVLPLRKGGLLGHGELLPGLCGY